MDGLARDVKTQSALVLLVSMYNCRTGIDKLRTYNSAGNGKDDEVDNGQEDLSGRGSVLATVHDQPEHGRESV